MRHHTLVSQVAGQWHCRVGIRWQRLQCRISGFYFHRVTEPLQLWVACGQPAEFTPRLPWWPPFVWRWLVLTGWARYYPRPHRYRG